MQLGVLSSCCMARSWGPHKCRDAGGLRQDPSHQGWPQNCLHGDTKTSPDLAVAFTPNAFYGAAVVEETPAALRALHPAAAAPCCQGPAQNPTGWLRCHPLSLGQMLIPCRNATFGVLRPRGGRGGSAWGRAVRRGHHAEHPPSFPCVIWDENVVFHSPFLPGIPLACLRAVSAAHLKLNSILTAHCKEIPGMLSFHYQIKGLGRGPIAQCI